MKTSQTLKQTLNRSHPHIERRRAQPVTQPIAGPAMSIFAALLFTAIQVQAAPIPLTCISSGSDPCTLKFGALSVNFAQGQYSFDGDSQQSGQDSWVTGYTVGTYSFPDMYPQETPDSHGFSFAPAMAGQVGGSGFSGDHQVEAFFELFDVTFQAEPGWAIESLLMTITGKRRFFGDAYANLLLPNLTVIFSGEDFSATGYLPQQLPHFRAGFSLWTAYEEDDDGNAAVYGNAAAQLDRVSIQAQMKQLTVPEPSSPMLLAVTLMAMLATRNFRVGAKPTRSLPHA